MRRGLLLTLTLYELSEPDQPGALVYRLYKS